MRTLTTNAVVNESKDPHVLIRKYERQIAELKQELAMRDTFAGRAAVNYGDIGEVERQELNAKVRNYLNGETGVDAVPVETLKQVKEAFRQFKAVYTVTRADMEAELKKRPVGGSGVGADGAAGAGVEGGEAGVSDEGKDGEGGGGGGEGVGKAAASGGGGEGDADLQRLAAAALLGQRRDALGQRLMHLFRLGEGGHSGREREDEHGDGP